MGVDDLEGDAQKHPPHRNRRSGADVNSGDDRGDDDDADDRDDCG